MDLVIKTQLEIDPSHLESLEGLEPIQKRQLVLVAKAFQDVALDFERDFLTRLDSDLELVFEFGMKMAYVFDATDLKKPLFDAWSDNIDAVYVFHHGTVDEAGAKRIQGTFDPVDEDSAEDVALARAFDGASGDRL